jgi:hypothetical protein
VRVTHSDRHQHRVGAVTPSMPALPQPGLKAGSDYPIPPDLDLGLDVESCRACRAGAPGSTSTSAAAGLRRVG